MITVAIVSVIWVSVTLLTARRKPDAHTIAFFQLMRIPGPGWKTVARYANVETVPAELWQNVVAWLLCLAFLFSLTLGLGKMLLHNTVTGIAGVTMGLLFGILLWMIVRKMAWAAPPDAQPSPQCPFPRIAPWL